MRLAPPPPCLVPIPKPKWLMQAAPLASSSCSRAAASSSSTCSTRVRNRTQPARYRTPVRAGAGGTFRGAPGGRPPWPAGAGATAAAAARFWRSRVLAPCFPTAGRKEEQQQHATEWRRDLGRDQQGAASPSQGVGVPPAAAHLLPAHWFKRCCFSCTRLQTVGWACALRQGSLMGCPTLWVLCIMLQREPHYQTRQATPSAPARQNPRPRRQRQQQRQWGPAACTRSRPASSHTLMIGRQRQKQPGCRSPRSKRE